MSAARRRPILWVMVVRQDRAGPKVRAPSYRHAYGAHRHHSRARRIRTDDRMAAVEAPTAHKPC